MKNSVKPVPGAAIYTAGTDEGKPCVWMTVLPDANCDHEMYYVVEINRTIEKAKQRAEWWQRKENKSVLKNPISA